MMIKRLLIVGCWLLTAVVMLSEVEVGFAQDRKDSSVFGDIFRYGKIRGNVRSFYMSTDNQSPLNDYFAWGNAASLKVTSGAYKRFYLSAGGAVIYNSSSSDLTKPDSIGGSPSRYETELFDVTDPSRKSAMFRFENLALHWYYKKTLISAGRMEINEPLINTQDGRLRPGCVEGLFFATEKIIGMKIIGGWIDRISPRSTVNFYSVPSSIGIYPQGVGPNGQRSGYRNNLSSNGIGFLNIKYQWDTSILFGFSDFYVDNIMNTAITEVQAVLSHGKNSPSFKFLMMYLRQDAIHNGGNADQSKTYIVKGGQSNSASMQLSCEKSGMTISASYSLITADGRFLSPREWGKEPFYTFMQPERTEGCGDVQSGVVQLKYRAKRFALNTAFGYFKLPDVKNYRLNKYGLPSFYQVTAGFQYALRGLLRGMRVEFIYVYKGDIGNTYDEYKYIENKVNMTHYNFIVNYSF